MRFILIAMMLLPSLALAQPAPQQSPAIMALMSKLSDEIDSGLRCGTDKFTAQAQVQALTEKITKLEAEIAAAKSEPQK